MKKLAVSLMACWAVWQACGEEGAWLTDLPKAQAKAHEEKKLVLMDFNGSDWCSGCKELRKKVFNTQTFIDYAKNNLVLVDVDFPEKKQQTEELKRANKALAEKFTVEGFPTVLVLNGDGKELKRLDGYEGESPKEFIAKLEKLKRQS